MSSMYSTPHFDKARDVYFSQVYRRSYDRCPYFKGKDEKNYLGSCSTCWHLFYEKDHTGFSSFYWDPPKPENILFESENGIYTRYNLPDPKRYRNSPDIYRKMLSTARGLILQGISYYHTQFDLSPEDHFESQRKLLHESYHTYVEYTDVKEEAVMYMDVSNGWELTVNGKRKVTHPHVNIKEKLPYYGPAEAILHNETDDSRDFIEIALKKSYEYSHLGRKIFLKFYLRKNFIYKAEIDLDVKV